VSQLSLLDTPPRERPSEDPHAPVVEWMMFGRAMTVAELVEASGLEPAEVRRQLPRLAAQGIIERPTKARSWRLCPW